MNITLYDNYPEAEADANKHIATTGIAHLVIERFRRSPIDPHSDSFLGHELSQAERLFTVLSEAEWNLVKDDWDAEVSS